MTKLKDVVMLQCYTNAKMHIFSNLSGAILLGAYLQHNIPSIQTCIEDKKKLTRVFLRYVCWYPLHSTRKKTMLPA